jgi:hypothetical protein
LQGGDRNFAQILLGSEAVCDESVADFAGDFGHVRPHAGKEHLWLPVWVGSWVEEGSHDRVGVELTPKGQLFARVPGVPDGPHGQHKLAHPCGRRTPRHRESLFDVRLDLASEAKVETAFGEQLQVVGRVRQSHWATSKGHCNRRAKFDRVGVLGSDREWQERVMACFRHPHAVESGGLLGFGSGGDLGEFGRDGTINAHPPTVPKERFGHPTRPGSHPKAIATSSRVCFMCDGGSGAWGFGR